MQGDIVIKGLVVIGETGKVICPELKAETVVVAGTVRGNITCQKLEIRSTGRVWGDVVAVSFSSEDGAFLRGQMRMEERIEIQLAEEQSPVEPRLPEAQSIASRNSSPRERRSAILPEPVSERLNPKIRKPKLKSPWES